MKKMSIFMKIYYEFVILKNSIVLGVLKPMMKAEHAFANVRPKTKETEVAKEIEEDRITFADIAGYDAAKESLEFFVNCLKNHAVRSAAGAEMPAGVLLYGPPGTDKNALAAAIAGSADVPLFAVSAKTFDTKYTGYAYASVKLLYQQARESAPCVVFIDDIDALDGVGADSDSEAYRARRTLLTELDGMDGSGVLTVAATNRIGDLNPDLMRPGRFVHKIEIPLPE